MNTLNTTQLNNLKPDPNKSIKLSDGEGLYIQVEQKNNKISKLWRVNYRFNGKQKTYSIGRYPDIGLKEARNERQRIKNLIANSIDPMEQKQEQKRQIQVEQKR